MPAPSAAISALGLHCRGPRCHVSGERAQGGSTAPQRPGGDEPAGRSQPADTDPGERESTCKDGYGLIIVSSKSYDLESSIEDFANGDGSELACSSAAERHAPPRRSRRALRRAARAGRTWRAFPRPWMRRDAFINWARSNALAFGSPRCRAILQSTTVADGPARAGIRCAASRRHPARDVGEVGVHRRGSLDDLPHARNRRRHRGSRRAGHSGAVAAGMQLRLPPPTVSRRERRPAMPV